MILQVLLLIPVDTILLWKFCVYNTRLNEMLIINYSLIYYLLFTQKRRRKRNFGPNWGKWPKGIVPYVFDASLGIYFYDHCNEYLINNSTFSTVILLIVLLNQLISFLIPDVNRGYFLQAIELFNNFTCVKWKPKSPEVAAEVGHEGYVLVRRYNLPLHSASFWISGHQTWCI